MSTRDQIIQLGKCLAAEAQAGYSNAVKDGLDAFLAAWSAEANGAARDPIVGAALARLHGYGALAVDDRKVRLDESLAQLRALFRGADEQTSKRAKLRVDSN